MEASQRREAWNRGKLVGQKPTLKPNIWAIRIHLQNANQVRDLAMEAKYCREPWSSSAKRSGRCSSN